jgi:hypothetical protein
MLLVKTKLGISSIDGIGLFADENIQAGTKVWEWLDSFDVVYDVKDFCKLPPQAILYIQKYAWYDDLTWYLCGDNDRFANHSNTPNCVSDGKIDIAIRDIKRGEEFTYNYWEFHKGTEL